MRMYLTYSNPVWFAYKSSMLYCKIIDMN
jgi:hypothetical protein